jgi:hypothetical protein
MTYSQPLTFTAGTDLRGNPITYLQNPDGSWTNLLTETLLPAEFVRTYFSRHLNPLPKKGAPNSMPKTTLQSSISNQQSAI